VFLVIVLEDADPATFEVLATNMARDKNHVWYYSTIQPEADPATVELVDGGRVFKDHDSVSYAYEPVPGAHPASFKHLASGSSTQNPLSPFTIHPSDLPAHPLLSTRLLTANADGMKSAIHTIQTTHKT